MKIIIILAAILIFVSCSDDKPTILATELKDTSTSTIEKSSIPTNIDKNGIAVGSRWTAAADTSKYMIDITFHDQYLLYWYHGQCQYYYFTYNFRDSIELLWTFKTDCKLNMNMLEKSFGLKNYPKNGDAFSSYKLVNDSIIKVNYYFSEWTTKINQVAEDSVFPKYFRKVPE